MLNWIQNLAADLFQSACNLMKATQILLETLCQQIWEIKTKHNTYSTVFHKQNIFETHLKHQINLHTKYYTLY